MSFRSMRKVNDRAALSMNAAKASAFRNRIVGHGEEAPDQLLANPANWRGHSHAQEQTLEGVLEQVGWVQEVIVNRSSGQIVDGHLRVALALSRNEPTIPVKYVDLTDDEEKLILATLDPIASMAFTDAEKLDALLKEVNSDSAAVQTMLSELAAEAGLYTSDTHASGDPGAQIDRAAELVKKYNVERGQCWILGRHRIICGSSYDSAMIAQLMNGAAPDMLHTDPPYGINAVNAHIDGKGLSSALKNLPPGFSRRQGSVARKTGSTHRASRTAIIVQPNLYPVIEGDDKPFDPSSFMDIAPIIILWGANNYADKLPTSQAWIAWDKREDITRNDFSDCELAWCNTGKVSRCFHHLWNGLHKGSQNGERRVHPTEKPVALFAEIGKMYADKGLWVDLFAGSGAQLVAAEQTGATCYAMEYEPLYVAVILERMAGMGLEPRLEGQT